MKTVNEKRCPWYVFIALQYSPLNVWKPTGLDPCVFIFLTSFHRSVNTSISVRVKIILSLLSSHSATVDFWILEDWGVILSGDNLIIRGNNPYYSRELNESAALNQRLKAKKALTSFNKVRLYLRWPPRPRGLWLDGSRTVIF